MWPDCVFHVGLRPCKNVEFGGNGFIGLGTVKLDLCGLKAFLRLSVVRWSEVLRLFVCIGFLVHILR